MQGFQYKHGDRPLEGYTIQRAAGRGGFGEVYYALSDSGREVALKLVQGYEQIELRGITQCMNLKSPHLVSVFDVKRNDEGKCFVIMEFVAGPSLRDLIDQTPGGMGSQKAAYFLREIGKGLTYLHDCGIVHRDLKPGNIFYENGYVKIGDYGLSKAITPSQHSGQTITVGTVHYMAPEIGAGVYDARIDIYALGALLYEMLTGQPPFNGVSVGEILMKHISAEPDLTGIEEPFASVIRKAMAKNPQDRYQTVQEMIEAVFGTEHIRNSVSHFAPDSLTMIAGRAAREIPVTENENNDDIWNKFSRRIDEAGKRLGSISEKVVPEETTVSPDQIDPNDDPLNLRMRFVLVLAVITLISLGCLAFAPKSMNVSKPDDFLGYGLFVFTMIAGMTAGVRLAVSQLSKVKALDNFVWQLSVSCSGTLGGILISGPIWIGERFTQKYFAGTWLAVAAVLFFIKWRGLTSPVRKERVSLKNAIFAGIIGGLAANIFGGLPELTLGVLAGCCLTVQIASPFIPENLRRLSKPRKPVATPIPAQASVPTQAVSPYTQSMALILAIGGFLIVPGLHRFYVGKIGTGILWFFTRGGFGIGQLVDIVMILNGQFTDKLGRRLTRWKSEKGNNTPFQVTPPKSTQPEPTAPQPSYYIAPPTKTNPFLTAMGVLLVLIAFLIGLIFALHLPQALAAGFPDPSVSGEMQRMFAGMPNWPTELQRIGKTIPVLLLLLACALFFLARRRAGGWHMIRAILGSVGLIFSLGFLMDGLCRLDWPAMVGYLNNKKPELIVQAIIQGIQTETAILATIFTLSSIFVLAWPAKEPAGVFAAVENEGV